MKEQHVPPDKPLVRDFCAGRSTTGVAALTRSIALVGVVFLGASRVEAAPVRCAPSNGLVAEALCGYYGQRWDVTQTRNVLVTAGLDTTLLWVSAFQLQTLSPGLSGLAGTMRGGTAVLAGVHGGVDLFLFGPLFVGAHVHGATGGAVVLDVVSPLVFRTESLTQTTSFEVLATLGVALAWRRLAFRTSFSSGFRGTWVSTEVRYGESVFSPGTHFAQAVALRPQVEVGVWLNPWVLISAGIEGELQAPYALTTTMNIRFATRSWSGLRAGER